MILDRLIYALAVLFNQFLSVFPLADVGVISAINSYLEDFRYYASQANFMIPVNTLFLLIGIVLSIEAVLLGKKLVRWIVSNVSLGFIK